MTTAHRSPSVLPPPTALPYTLPLRSRAVTRQVFEEMGITPYNLNIDSLGMHSDESTFCRFDKFNLKYNPLGKSRLREIFLTTENVLAGRYFAELTHELFDDLKVT